MYIKSDYTDKHNILEENGKILKTKYGKQHFN